MSDYSKIAPVRAIETHMKQHLEAATQARIQVPPRLQGALGGGSAGCATAPPGLWDTPSTALTLKGQLEDRLAFFRAAVDDLENALRILNADPKIEEFLHIVQRRL